MNFIRAQWNEVGNVAIAGDTGSGKTTSCCFLAAQVALAGGKLIVCDPHGNAPAESIKQTLSWNVAPLKSSFMCDVAINDDDISDAIHLANDILNSRKRGSAASYPVWLLVDEFSSLMRNNKNADALSLLLEDIATEGRKFFVSTVLMGSQWHTDRAGGGELRSVINIALIHRMKRQTANLLLGLGKHLPDTFQLATGEAYLYNRGIRRVQIPYTTRQDMLQVASVISDGQTAVYGPDKQVINTVSTEQEAKKSSFPKDATYQRIIELFESGKNVSDVAREVFAVRSGPPYQHALARVNEVLREEYIR